MNTKYKNESEKTRALFREKIVFENSKRFIVLVIWIAISQVVLFALTMLGVAENLSSSKYVQILTVALCVIFVLIIKYLRNSAFKENSTKLLTVIMMIIHVLILGVGCYFTTLMFKNNFFSYSLFLIAAFFVSITHIRWPYFSAALLAVIFVILAVYLGNSFDVPGDFLMDTFTSYILLILISVGNMLNYKHYWRLFKRESEIRKMNKSLSDISERDLLTNAYNRRKILDEINRVIKLSERLSSKFCLVMIDLDKFKDVNDQYGHNAGDSVLREFSKIICSNLRDNDILGRWGGEEFIIVLPQAEKEGALKLIDRIRKLVEKHNFAEVGKMTFSAGICEYCHEYNDDTMIGNADFALYLSKQLGRNKVSVYSSSM